MDVVENKPYWDAILDPKARFIEPGLIVIRPFHMQWPGVEQEWHAYCREHPEFGFCGYEHDAVGAARDHYKQAHTPQKGGS